MLCVQAEEIGRALAPIPFLMSVCGYAVALDVVAEVEAKASLLPAAADGSAIGVLLTDDCWRQEPRLVPCDGTSAVVEGVAGNVPDGAAATAAIAGIGAGDAAAIVHLSLTDGSCERAAESLDLLHPCASFDSRADRPGCSLVARAHKPSGSTWSIAMRC